MFAKYYDHVQDSRDISATSRFLSGGIGGLTSQLCKLFYSWTNPLLTVHSNISYRDSQSKLSFADRRVSINQAFLDPINERNHIESYPTNHEANVARGGFEIILSRSRGK